MERLEVRIARRFLAETLTKPWLMAVRRGWQSLMKPSISDYGDVFKAFNKLALFVKNFRDQILNLRRGPYSASPSMSEHGDLLKALNKLEEAIKEGHWKAKHWQDSYEGVGLPGQDPQARKNGEYMLNLYKKDFQEATAISKDLRGGRSKQVPITEHLDTALKILYEDAARIKNHDERNPGIDLEVKRDIFKQFQLGSAKIVVLDQKTNGKAIELYIKLLDEAFQDLKRKGFSKLWYGVLFITLGEFEKLSPEVQKAYANAGYLAMEGRAGTYHSGDDLVQFTSPPTRHFRITVIHELGHRYWFKFMSQAQRAKFEMLVEGTYTKTRTVLLNLDHLKKTKGLEKDDIDIVLNASKKLESGVEPSTAEKSFIDELYEMLGVRAGVELVSDYAKSSIQEAFAEVFTRYVTEDALTRPQVESFRSVLSFDPLAWKAQEGDLP